MVISTGLTSRIGYNKPRYGATFSRVKRKHPDILLEDYLYGRGEFSIGADEGRLKRLKENMRHGQQRRQE